MSRLSEADVARFVGALRGETPKDARGEAHGEMRAQPALEEPAPAPKKISEPTSPASDRSEVANEVARVRTAMASAVEGRSIAPAIDQALRSYLGRDIHCATHGEPPAPADALRFEADGAISLHVDLDAPLAAALADVAIGGDGTNTKHGRRALIGRTLEKVVLEMMRAIAPLGGLEPPSEIRFIEIARRQATPVAGGSMIVGAASGVWSASVAQRQSRASAQAPRESDRPSAAARVEKRAAAPTAVPREPEYPPQPAPREVVHATPAPQRERVLAAPAVDETDGAFGAAVEAARARLGETLHCATTLEAMHVARVDAPALQRGDLKLALIAGGQGSLVLSADRETVTSVAATAVGADAQNGYEPGAVAVDAVEAALRAAMRGFAAKLPAIAGSPSRFVRLAEGALPARSPHFAIVAPVRIGERAATLQWLVPVWMAGARSDPRNLPDVP